MASTEADSDRTVVVTVEQRYVQMCTDIRFTDDISLKLLGLIPLVSGAGILGRPEPPPLCFGWWHAKDGNAEAKRICIGWCHPNIGKTEAERILYTAVIISWLALPGIAALLA